MSKSRKATETLIKSARTPQESTVVMTEMVLPQHTNPLGNIFGGVVMSWIDICAAIAAQRHSRRICVTASIDELHFLRPIKKGFVVNLESRVTAVHNTSCEVMINVNAEDPISGERSHTARAFMTFVALDSSGHPTPMPPLKVQTRQEKKWCAEALIRKEARKALKARLENDSQL